MHDYRLQFGKLAGAWFFLCLYCFAAIDPTYSHLTKAVSELGAFGASHALAWNALGFFLTGAMLILFGLGLRNLLARRQVHSTGAWAVILMGALFAATAIPADFELRMQSPWTVAHAVFVLLGPVMFLWAVMVWPRALAKMGASRQAIIACVMAGLLIVPAFVSNAFLAHAPGMGQRLGFLAVFLWCWVLSTVAVRLDGANSRD